MTDAVSRNLDSVFERIAAACLRSGRNPAEVSLAAVTKYAAREQIAALLRDGRVKFIGESRLQDALVKWADMAAGGVKKRFIGHLQTNKAARAAEFFDAVDSVDNLRIAEALSKRACELEKKLDVLIQLKLTDSASQSGVGLEAAPRLADGIRKLPGLRLLGYMAIAPRVSDPQELRPVFRRVMSGFEKNFAGVEGRILSLGMSEDFEVAVEEGSTLPRIGSAIFSAQEDIP